MRNLFPFFIFKMYMNGIAVTLQKLRIILFREESNDFSFKIIRRIDDFKIAAFLDKKNITCSHRIFSKVYFLVEIMRSVYLKGTSIAELWVNYAALGGFAVFFCCLAALTYKKQQ